LDSNANFYASFERACERDPSALCIENEAGVVHSYADIDRMSAQFAHALQSLGCRPDDRVAVQIEKSAQALALFLGALRAGLIYLPLNTAYKSTELTHFLSDAQPRVFVCSEDSRESMRDFAASLGVSCVEGMGQDGRGSMARLAATQPGTFETVHRTPEDIATIMYTSGTTGRSKGAMLSCRAVNSCAEGLAKLWEFESHDVLLHALPIFHAHGLFVSTCVALRSGASLLFHRKFDIEAVLASLPRSSVMMGVPTFYHRLLADDRFTRGVCSSMRLFTSGSAPLTAQVQSAFRERTGHEVLERYGATETMILTSNPLHGERRPGSVGLPLPGIELRISDKHDQPLPSGQIGMIQVRGPGLFSGYWRLPAKSAEDMTPDGFFRTGDLGEQSVDGYVRITGRAKDLIISGGYNVYPVEVEFVLDAHESVAESAVIGIPHPDFGEAVAAVVTLRAGGAGVTSQELISWIKPRIANYKVPKQLVIVEQLPRNALGKVQKNVLRETFEKLVAAT
jgi:malonyl-CoA/methylmalonyl-CoA synthetase